MKHNLLTEAIFTVDTRTEAKMLSLPRLLAAMAQCDVQGFERLRPHQRAAWHMFLVQLAALAIWRDGARGDVPEDEAVWAKLLRRLTEEFAEDVPWHLVVDDRTKPAFLQPPDPGELKWSDVPTPDALDMLITARNHDLKKQVAKNATVEDWVFALVSLQTMEGFCGKGNYGIARMNGGSSSRAMLALAPAGRQAHGVDPSEWWRRDLRLVLAQRASGSENGPCVNGGKALLWLEDWSEGEQLTPEDLDPWFIEICRRIRLNEKDSGLYAKRATSRMARIDAGAFKGVLGDSWAPVCVPDSKALTLGDRELSYGLLNRLLYSGDWDVPYLAQRHADEKGDAALVIEALARGNSKTDGMKTRIIPVPESVASNALSSKARDIAREQVEAIDDLRKLLFKALVLKAAQGDIKKVKKLSKKDKDRAVFPGQTAFERAADEMFFSCLWDQLAAHENGEAARNTAGDAFRTRLEEAARDAFEAALPSVPCAVLFRLRAEARARAKFYRGANARGYLIKRRKAE